MNIRWILSKIFLLPVVKIRFLFLSFLLLLLVLSTFSQFGRQLSTGTFLRPAVLEPHLPESCDGRWIYIYNLDHVFNLEFVRNCSTFKKNVDLCPYMDNGGMGRGFAYEPEFFDSGVWYNTWQFSLEVYFHERLLRYPCISPKEESANAFYVPFYAGMDLSNRMSHPSQKQYRKKNYMELLDWLRGQYFFLRNGGFDHFITLGRIALDFRRPRGDSFGTQMLREPDFQNMVKLTIERDGSTPVYSDNEIAIPYPSYFHPQTNSQIQELIDWSSRNAQRSVLVSIIGGRRRAGQGGIKEKVMMDCEKHTRCTVVVCEGHEGANQTDLHTRSFNFLPIAGHTLHESCNFPTSVLDVFHRSVFCLQPPGDSPSRRSFFDSLLAGCIPVIFQKNSAWSQYPAFLPQKGEVYSVLVPLPEVRKNSVISILENISRKKIESMRSQIKHLLPRIIYAHVERNYPRYGESDEDVLEGADAFNIALDEVFSLMRKNLDMIN